MRVPDAPSSFWQYVLIDEIAQVLGSVERHDYPAGATLVVEGEIPPALYILEWGFVDVLVAGPGGAQYRAGRAGPGNAVGEIALLTGQPASATVRAATDLRAVVLPVADFFRVAALHPQMYRALGTLLGEKLAAANRRPARVTRVTMLLDRGAPPLLAYALACSVAWHSRQPTLLLMLSDREPSSELAALADRAPGLRAVPGRLSGPDAAAIPPADLPRAHLLLARPSGPYAPGALAATLDELYSLERGPAVYPSRRCRREGLAAAPGGGAAMGGPVSGTADAAEAACRPLAGAWPPLAADTRTQPQFISSLRPVAT